VISATVQGLADKGGLQILALHNSGTEVDVLTSLSAGNIYQGGMQLVTLSLKSLGEMEERDAGMIDAAAQLINTLPPDAAINSYGAAAFVELPPDAGHQLGYLALQTNRSTPQLQAARLAFGNA